MLPTEEGDVPQKDVPRILEDDPRGREPPVDDEALVEIHEGRGDLDADAEHLDGR